MLGSRREGCFMPIMEGDQLKHKLNGLLYKVKIVKDGTVVLESEDSPNRVWFGDKDVKLFFETVERRKK
jgi:hypothetical protein